MATLVQDVRSSLFSPDMHCCLVQMLSPLQAILDAQEEHGYTPLIDATSLEEEGQVTAYHSHIFYCLAGGGVSGSAHQGRGYAGHP